jgi:uncharacterized protein (TIGR00255 family)
MTGFGRGEVETETWRVTVDVRTVNHRGLDVDVRGLNLPASLETAMTKQAGQALSRGKCEVSVALRPLGEAAAELRVNEPVVRAHVKTLRRLRDELGLAGEVSVADLTLLPWNRAFELSDPQLGDEGEAAALKALDEALKATVETRAREGRELHADLSARLATLGERLQLVREAADGIAEAQRLRLLQRLESLAADVKIDEQRLAQEAALLADRSDISEEITRFAAYLERLAGQLDESGAQGKRLDFVLQESLREVNTMGSKSRGLEVSHAVIDMKTELERMREQVANVE